MTDLPLRVGVIGLGLAGARLHLPALRRLPGVVVVAAADPDGAARAAVDVPTVDDWRALVSNPGIDAVLIASPPVTHSEIALAALGSGRHVYLEKPMATSLVEARQVAAAAAGRGRVLQLGFAYRFHPLWGAVRKLVRQGRLIPPFHAESRFAAETVRDGWWTPAVDIGCHHVDLVSWLLGTQAQRVEAEGHHVKVTWPGGTTLAGDYSPGPPIDLVTLVGRGGRDVVIDRRHGVRLRGSAVPRAMRRPDARLVRSRMASGDWERSFEWALAAFVAACRVGPMADQAATADDGVAAVAYGEAVIASAATGEPMEVAGK